SYYPDHPWAGYRWDANENEFKDDLLEYDLFILHDPNEALKIANQLLLSLDEWPKDYESYLFPYTYYVVGLTYELSGDQQKAAQVYWEIWHDFPASPFAVLAKYKLVKVEP